MGRPEALGQPTSPLEQFYQIADGRIFNAELDRGGFWSPQDRLWVDQQLRSYVEHLPTNEQQLVATLGQVGLGIGRVFERQLADAQAGIMWPSEVFDEDGAGRILTAYGENEGVADPYSNLMNGLQEPSVPYTQAYRDELKSIRTNLQAILDLPSTSLSDQHYLFIQAMIAAYKPDDGKTTDFADMGMVDTSWVRIPAEADWLFFAQPTEVYHDPARVEHSQHPQIASWANRITDARGIGPWKTFFEFRLLVKDESMVSKDEIQAIREMSRQLFKDPDDPEVSASTEFRRLLMASGNGAHPAKTAKNYPNFEDIRDNIGYKNVIYTNMVEEGTRTHIIPALQAGFAPEVLAGYTEEQLIRGSALRVLAHEENHPFRRFRDTPLEELKATIHGIQAAIESDRFSETDINTLILSEIGAALYGRHKLQQARHDGDTNAIKGSEAYNRADTIMMNYLQRYDAFIKDGEDHVVSIDFEAVKTGVGELVKALQVVRTGDVEVTIPQFYIEYEDDAIWDQFSIMEVKA